MIKTKKNTGKKVKNTDKSINPKETLDNYFSINIEKCDLKPPKEKKSTQKPPTKKKDESATPVKKTLMDYFPVRHSNRQNRSTLLKEKTKVIEDAILSQREDGLKVETFPEKGRGVQATKHFRRGDFVVEYSGELVDSQEAKLREEKYAMNENIGCYMYYFKLNDKNYCVDATVETKRFGRLINHSRHGNLSIKPFLTKNVPCLIMIAAKDIKPGEELLFDYGDRSKESLANHPWLAK